MKTTQICLLLILLTITKLAIAQTTHKQEGMLNDLKFIESIFQDFYATTHWKKEYSGWNLEAETNPIRQAIINNPNIQLKEFHCLIKNLFMSPKDYHVSIDFYSTELASLPFQVKGVDGRYFFSYISESTLASKSFPFVKGDELLSFNDVAIHDVVTTIKNEDVGNNNDQTDYALAEIFLTSRLGMLGHVIPNGAVKLTGRKKGSTKELSCTLEWDYEPEKITMPPKAHVRAHGLKLPEKINPFANSKFFKKQFVCHHYKAMSALSLKAEEGSDVLGSKKSFLPSIGRVIWESDEDAIFHSYVSTIPGGKFIGYIRIPSYTPENLDNALAEFLALIQIFNTETDALVIDQVNNPGGYLLYVYALASMLTDKPMSVPKHRIMLTQSDIFLAHTFIDVLKDIESDEAAVEAFEMPFLQGMSVDYQFVQSLTNHFEFIINEWDVGNRLTQPCYFHGIGPLQPHKEANYTKPILVLVNSLDFSGGDFFPAILQDNKRAKIFGTRTAGAGGVLEEISFPNLRGIASIQYTASIAERDGEFLIENRGVTPDIPYKVSAYDLQNDYAEYIREVVKALQSL